MSTSARLVSHSYSEYLALEESSPTRHEYLQGEIYAMAGGSPDHAALAAGVIGLLRSGLPHGCRVFTSDLRVRVAATGLSTYPDVTVVCGPSARAHDDPMAVTNPILLVEVTSPSTEAYDRGEKLRHYKTIESLRDIVIVSHREVLLQRHSRAVGGDWQEEASRTGESLVLSSVGAQILVDDIYRGGLEDAV